jgi:hypothetical protein
VYGSQFIQIKRIQIEADGNGGIGGKRQNSVGENRPGNFNKIDTE